MKHFAALLEVLKLLLNSLFRKKALAANAEIRGEDKEEQAEIQRLIRVLEEAYTSESIKMGGIFLELIAQIGGRFG